MKRLVVALLVLSTVSIVGAPAHAFDWFGGRLSIGGGFGRAKPKLPYTYQDQYQDGDMWTANAKYFINNDLSVVASYADLEPYLRGDKNNFFRFRPVVGSLRYNLFHHLPVTPYIIGGAGYSTNKREVPNGPTVKWDGFTYQAGLGFEFFITEGTSIGVEGLYHHFRADPAASSPYRLATVAGMMNIYFGAGPSAQRAEKALEEQKAAAAAAQAAAEAARQQALASQQQATSAQQQQSASEAAAAAAKAQADAAAAQAQQQVQQAQAEVQNLKQMMASKEVAPITFRSGSADLLASSNPTLDKVGAIAKKYPSLKLRIEGYTDNVGGDTLNQTLSEKRANAIKDYLTSQGGVAADQVTAVGYGKGNPIASNDTAEGRSRNRRVEFTFIVK